MFDMARTLIIRYRDEPGDTCPICHIGTLRVWSPNPAKRRLERMHVLVCSNDRKHWRTASNNEAAAYERSHFDHEA